MLHHALLIRKCRAEGHDYCRSAGYFIIMFESFHILNALPAKRRKENLLKCNSKNCFHRASCRHVVLAGMVVYESINMPIRYDRFTLQIWRKRVRPVKKSAGVASGAEEDGAPLRASRSPGSSKATSFHRGRFTCIGRNTWSVH